MAWGWLLNLFRKIRKRNPDVTPKKKPRSETGANSLNLMVVMGRICGKYKICNKIN